MGKDQAIKELFQEEKIGNFKAQEDNSNWVIMESCDLEDVTISDSFTRSSMESSQENSINSIASSSSSDLVEDASSNSSSSKSLSSSISFSSPNSTLSNGPLFELSELMVHLPLRRGLSKFYQGKSQSFTSLASVKSVEDLPKKVAPFRKNKAMKSCKSYCSKLHSPKTIIAKKSSRGSSFLSSQLGSFRPSVPMQNNF